MASRGKMKRSAGAVAAAGLLGLGGLVGLGLSATPAAAHGCSHTNHWDYYRSDGHAHWASYDGYYNSNGVHWHLWSDVHGRYQTACY